MKRIGRCGRFRIFRFAANQAQDSRQGAVWQGLRWRLGDLEDPR